MSGPRRCRIVGRIKAAADRLRGGKKADGDAAAAKPEKAERAEKGEQRAKGKAKGKGEAEAVRYEGKLAY